MGFLYEAATRLVAQMTQASIAGASEALRNREIGLKAQAKSGADGDIVTQGDKSSQAVIFALLPVKVTADGKECDVGFHGEEALHEGYAFPKDATWRWCVDPIDGTKPYFNGEKYWSISIALQSRTSGSDEWQTEIGVVYRASGKDTPQRPQGKVYWAIKGRGAFVLDIPSGRQSQIVKPDAIQPFVEFEAKPEVTTPEAEAYAKKALDVIETAQMGHGWRRSICHSTCELLDGEKAAVVQGVAGPFDWDIGAISLIAAEAGLNTSFAPRVQFEGKWRYPAIMAWDRALFDQLMAIRAAA